jgi:polar amino acid transport system ATP-binding protein/sulfate transport system ATP-binding protein
MSRDYILKDTLVQIKDVNVSFGGRHVLLNVNAEVRDIVRPGCTQGQVIGILGPSGVGKSIMARVLTGLQTPDSGQVLIGPKSDPVQAGTVGYVSQHYPLFRHRTVLGNLMLAAKQGRTSEDAKSKAEEYLQRFDLSAKWDAYPGQLSGGQRQRVAIAQQLLCSEHYLVLDEPTTGLDPIMKDHVCDLIRQVSNFKEENTVFVVTHDIPAALSVADRLWLFGRVRREIDLQPIGANIRYTYDLIERGIAWEEKPEQLPAFTELAREIRARFEEL